MLDFSTAILDQMKVAKPDGNNTMAWTQGRSLAQLGVNYRWSSIVIDERATDVLYKGQPSRAYGGEESDGLHAGDRAPDAPGLVNVRKDINDSTSLFDIFQPSYHTVLFFGTEHELLSPALSALKDYPLQLTRSVVICPKGMSTPPVINGADLVLVDQQGHAYAGYGVSSENLTIVIVRPDAVVGGIVFGVAGIKRYFRGVFSAV